MMAYEQEITQAAATAVLNHVLGTKAVKKVVPKFPQLLNVGPWHCRINALAKFVKRAFIFVGHIHIAKAAQQQSSRRHATSTNSC